MQSRRRKDEGQMGTYLVTVDLGDEVRQVLADEGEIAEGHLVLKMARTVVFGAAPGCWKTFRSEPYRTGADEKEGA